MSLTTSSKGLSSPGLLASGFPAGASPGFAVCLPLSFEFEARASCTNALPIPASPNDARASTVATTWNHLFIGVSFDRLGLGRVGQVMYGNWEIEDTPSWTAGRAAKVDGTAEM